MCDSSLQHMNFSLLYAGKPNGQPNELYVTKTDEYTKYIVNGAHWLLEGGWDYISVQHWKEFANVHVELRYALGVYFTEPRCDVTPMRSVAEIIVRRTSKLKVDPLVEEGKK